MGRIFFDTEQFDTLSSNIDDIKSSLNTMKTKVEGFDVPSVWYDWFSYKNYLDDKYKDSNSSNLCGNIIDSINNCDEVLNWLSSAKTNLGTFSEDAVSSFTDIEVPEIKTRSSIVVSK